MFVSEVMRMSLDLNQEFLSSCVCRFCECYFYHSLMDSRVHRPTNLNLSNSDEANKESRATAHETKPFDSILSPEEEKERVAHLDNRNTLIASLKLN